MGDRGIGRQVRLVKTRACVLVDNLLEAFKGENLTPEQLLCVSCLRRRRVKRKWE